MRILVFVGIGIGGLNIKVIGMSRSFLVVSCQVVKVSRGMGGCYLWVSMVLNVMEIVFVRFVVMLIGFSVVFGVNINSVMFVVL